MNQLLKLVLKLIMKHIGDETAEWMTKIAVYAQQIIINTSEELLKDPILPLAEKLRKKVEAMYAKEESLKGYLKAAADDASQVIYRLAFEYKLFFTSTSLFAVRLSFFVADDNSLVVSCILYF